jgi:hypothetical protein
MVIVKGNGGNLCGVGAFAGLANARTLSQSDDKKRATRLRSLFQTPMRCDIFRAQFI